MADALQDKIDCNSACEVVGQFPPKIKVDVDVHRQRVCTDKKARKCLTTLSMTLFTQRDFVSDFLLEK